LGNSAEVVVNLLLDSAWDDQRRRSACYAGDILAFSARESVATLAELARVMLEAAFAPYHPVEAQYYLPVEEYAAVLSAVKPRFINHEACKTLIPALLTDIGADTADMYFDVPRLRSATADGYLTSGIAYAFHPHRDTWYSAPLAQINWWLPIYAIEPDNAMAFYPSFFARPVANSSETYNYYRWNRESRAAASSQIGTDTRVQPRITADVDLGSDLRIIIPESGMIAFSGQQLHETIPNATAVTRFSIDFRTVHRGDLDRGLGALNVDSQCTGTTLRDFLRCADLSRLPDDLIARYDDESSLEYSSSLVYDPHAR
jgi:hypothetical protein